MTWIKTLTPSPEHPELLAAMHEALASYPPEYRSGPTQASRLPEDVKSESVVRSHSLIPEALRHVFAGYGAMLDPRLPLSRRQHEMVATTVSVLNDCYY